MISASLLVIWEGKRRTGGAQTGNKEDAATWVVRESREVEMQSCSRTCCCQNGTKIKLETGAFQSLGLQCPGPKQNEWQQVQWANKKRWPNFKEGKYRMSYAFKSLVNIGPLFKLRNKDIVIGLLMVGVEAEITGVII